MNLHLSGAADLRLARAGRPARRAARGAAPQALHRPREPDLRGRNGGRRDAARPRRGAEGRPGRASRRSRSAASSVGCHPVLRDGLQGDPGGLRSSGSSRRTRRRSASAREVGVLSLGAGLLIGVRVTLSTGIGMVLAWVIAPEPLFARGLVPALTFNAVLQRWIMWPATGLMVAGGLTALALKWRVIAKTFQGLGARGVADGGDFPMRWVVRGAIAAAVTLAARAVHLARVPALALGGLGAPLARPDARRHPRAGRDELGADQRDGERDAGGVRRARAGARPDQHDRLAG